MKEPKLRFKEENGMQFPDWEKSKFSDVFDNINNSTFSRDCLNYVDGNVKYIHYGDILTTFDSMVNVEASDVPYVNKDIDCQKYQLLADGDIIVADTAEDDTVGKAVEIVSASNVKVISGLHTIACRPKLKFTSGYLGYYMNSNSYHNQLRPYMQGVKVTSISKANIALTNVSIPSLPEQQKIALLFSEIDTLIQSAEKELEGYRELKQGMLQKMFPKKGEKVPEIRFPEFTDDWEQRKLSEFVDKAVDNRGKTPPLDENGTHPLIEVAALGEVHPNYSKVDKYLNDDSYENNLRAYIKKGDILFTTVGSIGLVSIMDSREEAAIAQNIVAFRAKEGFIPEYLYALFSNEENQHKSKRIVMGAVQPSIKVSQLVDVEYMITKNVKEQKKIGEYFSNLDSLIALQQKELDGYKELKKGLLQQMFC